MDFRIGSAPTVAGAVLAAEDPAPILFACPAAGIANAKDAANKSQSGRYEFRFACAIVTAWAVIFLAAWIMACPPATQPYLHSRRIESARRREAEESAAG